VDIMASFGNRIIKARWASDKSESFEVNLKVIGTDRKGIVNDVTKLLSSMLHINITAIAFEGRSGVFEGNLSIGIRNAQQVDEIMAQLHQIDGVVNVVRYDY
jgi:guanosine-3',5'-bis(diphosphate) 3'-pyrophosphohydrolase